jgi:raffinose/stachyose/melibiose transport system permease protein
MKDKFISKYWGYLFLLIPIILQVIFFYLPTIRGVIFSFYQLDWLNGQL